MVFTRTTSQITGNIGIIFTYPDKVIKNDTIDVDLRLEYMKNENINSEYVVLDDIKIHIHDLHSRLDSNDLVTSSNISSSMMLLTKYFRTSLLFQQIVISSKVNKIMLLISPLL